MRAILGLAVLAAPFLSGLASAETTVGLRLNQAEAYEGYTLFGPLRTNDVFLVDNRGRQVHVWDGVHGTTISYLEPTGHMLRGAAVFSFDPVWDDFSAGRSGRVERWDWDGNPVWEYVISSETELAHHDVERLPNGNVLAIVWELKTLEEAIRAGRDPSTLANAAMWPDKIVEIEPSPPSGGTIVWEWHAWDHLVQDFDPTRDNFGRVEDNPGRIDVNWEGGAGNPDWMHTNAVDYNAELDQVMISVRRFSELWVIDHSTTTEEAAGTTGGRYGKGGDILYRWGNPQTYRRGTAEDRVFYRQHDAQWVSPGLPGEGNMLVHNNGWTRPVLEHSSIEEIVPPVDEDGNYVRAVGSAFGPADVAWHYEATPPESYYARIVSATQRMPNGNTLITDGPLGKFFEVTTGGETVWEYVNPVNNLGSIEQGTVPENNIVHRCRRYGPDYPGLAGRDLTPQLPLEAFVAPAPVPDGSDGSFPLTVAAMTLAGDQLQVEWDTDTCSASEYNLLYGSLGNVASLELDGARCGIGTAGSFFFDEVPGGDLFLLIVGVDATGSYESSWGTDETGVERHGSQASGFCNVPAKIETGTCP